MCVCVCACVRARVRVQIIEQRVIGLNQFLQHALASPQFACPDLADFLERGKNQPPAGLDVVLDASEAPDPVAPEGSADGAHQSQLKHLVESTSLVRIP